MGGGVGGSFPVTKPTYPLIIAQFALEGHPRRTEHWNISAFISTEEAQIFELAGGIDSYTFLSSTVSLRALECRGGFLLCRLPSDRLAWLKELFSTIHIVRANTEFDCQTWVVAAVRKLQDEGYIPRDVTENKIRRELDREKERWEVAEDTLIERLIPALPAPETMEVRLVCAGGDTDASKLL